MTKLEEKIHLYSQDSHSLKNSIKNNLQYNINILLFTNQASAQ